MIVVSSEDKVVYATLRNVDTALRLKARGHCQSTGNASESDGEAGKGNHDDFLRASVLWSGCCADELVVLPSCLFPCPYICGFFLIDDFSHHDRTFNLRSPDESQASSSEVENGSHGILEAWHFA